MGNAESDREGEKVLAKLAEEDPDFKEIAELLEESSRELEDVEVKTRRLRRHLSE
jgi:hypothetical protein